MFKLFKKIIFSNKTGLIDICISIALALFTCYVLINYSYDPNVQKICSFDTNNLFAEFLNIIVNPFISFSVIFVSFIQIIDSLVFYEVNHLREYALLKLYGVSISKILIYKIIQFSFILFISLFLSCIFIIFFYPIFQKFIYRYLCINEEIIWFSVDAFCQTISIILLIIAVAVLVDIYIYNQKDIIEMFSKSNIKYKNNKPIRTNSLFQVILYMLGIIFTLINEEFSSGIIMIYCISLCGIYGIVKYALPQKITFYIKQKILKLEKFIIFTDLRARFQNCNMIITLRYILIIFLPFLIVKTNTMTKLNLQLNISFYLLCISISFLSIFQFKNDYKIRNKRKEIWKIYGLSKNEMYYISKYECFLFYVILDIIAVPYVMLNSIIMLSNKIDIKYFYFYGKRKII